MANIISPTLLISFIFLSLFYLSKSEVLGFSSDLIHKDSPMFPFYNLSKTRFDRLHDAVRQSRIRENRFVSASNNVHSISSELIPSHGQYLMKISLGTPPVSRFVLADTDSEVSWVQCTPCNYCSKQKEPLFDPKKSSTYQVYPYESNQCQSLKRQYCSLNGTCEYEVDYSFFYTRGALASETLTLGSDTIPLVFRGFTFGCGFDNRIGLYEDQHGKVGLGGGPNSLVSQIRPSINGKFSYCLTPSFTETIITSRINFGNNADVSGTGVVSTPIIPKAESNHYYLNLEALSVGKDKVKLFNSTSESAVNLGNIFIDLGTPMTIILLPAYEKFVDLVRKAMGNKTVPDPKENFDLCYRISDKPAYPEIHAQFTNATIDLKPINTFVQRSPDITCLAFMKGYWGIQVFGSIAQTNFLVGYDTVKGIVSFKPVECGHVSH